jgi:phosphoglycolate phosphatase
MNITKGELQIIVAINLVIFDLDGTLINSISGITDAVNHTLREFNYTEVTEDAVLKYVSQGDEHLLASAFKSDCQDLIVRAIAVFRGYYFDNCNVVRLYDGIIETIKILRRNHKIMGVFSNKPLDVARKQLLTIGLQEYFSFLKADDGNIKLKPNPEAIEQILAEFGVEKAETLMVGDTEIDIKTGKAIGVLTCGVTYGFGEIEALRDAKPDFIIKDFRELIEITESYRD